MPNEADCLKMIVLASCLAVLLCIYLLIPRVVLLRRRIHISVFMKRLRYRTRKQEVHGFKGFRRGMTCQGMQYQEDGEFFLDDPPSLCNRGFHFCPRLTDVFQYYCENSDVYCPVTAFGSVDGDFHNDKRCTDALRIGRRLTPMQIYAILLSENSGLPKEHYLIDLVHSSVPEMERMHWKLDLILKWRARAGRYLARKDRSSKKGDSVLKIWKDAHHAKLHCVKRVNGRLKRQ